MVTPDMVQTGSDIPKDWQQPQEAFDYVKQDVMIPMRDGVKLHTVIMIPKGAHDLPMLLERTPYDASGFAPNNSPHMKDAVWSGDTDWADGRYILVWQDIRGKYGSEGDYVMTRPPRGPLNPSKTDDTTDAWDTIDWLVKNVKQSNGRVGMIGSSYDGWTVAMALLDPHPALKVAAPESPMVDGWMGDDWFHYGAFRQVNLDYFSGQSSVKGGGKGIPRAGYDDYKNFLERGLGRRHAQMPTASSNCPGGTACRRTPPMMPSGSYRRSTGWSPRIRRTFRRSGCRACGTRKISMARCTHGKRSRGSVTWPPTIWSSARGGTARSTVPAGILGRSSGTVIQPPISASRADHSLLRPISGRRRAVPKPMPQAMIYDPQAEQMGSASPSGKRPATRQLTPLYLQAEMGLGFGQGAGRLVTAMSLIRREPVPYLAASNPRQDNEDRWRTWLVQDQRFVANRADVLVLSDAGAEQDRSRSRARRSPTSLPRRPAPTAISWSR